MARLAKSRMIQVGEVDGRACVLALSRDGNRATARAAFTVNVRGRSGGDRVDGYAVVAETSTVLPDDSAPWGGSDPVRSMSDWARQRCLSAVEEAARPGGTRIERTHGKKI